ncbi:MAG: helix-turn-helix domain-containing protein [bacterium]
MKRNRSVEIFEAIDALKKVLGPLVSKLREAEDRKLYDLLMNSLDHSLIEYALEVGEGNQLAAAELLGISRNTLRRKIKKYNLTVERRLNRNRRSSE